MGAFKIVAPCIIFRSVGHRPVADATGGCRHPPATILNAPNTIAPARVSAYRKGDTIVVYPLFCFRRKKLVILCKLYPYQLICTNDVDQVISSFFLLLQLSSVPSYTQAA